MRSVRPVRMNQVGAWLIVSSFSIVSLAAAMPEAETLTLTLHWCDPHSLFPRETSAVARELRRAFEELDVSVVWVDEAPSGGRPPKETWIQVLLVRSEPATWRLPANAMGAVLSRGGPQREVYVFFDAVVRAVGYRPEALKRRWLTAREARDLSRALARVIAHEAIHAVLPDAEHTGKGLTRMVLDRGSLLDPGLEIEPSVARAFRAGLRRWRISVSSPAEDGRP